MASCGSPRMLQPVVRVGSNAWTPVKLLNQFRCGNSFSNPFLERFLLRSFTSVISRERSLSHSPKFFRRVSTRAQQHQQICHSLDKLNDEQKAVVRAAADCVRVVAGPGSGKTLVLTHRIAYLHQYRGVPLSNMLCITFTNKAKDELRQRLKIILGDDLWQKVTIGTFHSVCVRILREIASKDEIGIDKDFIIYDREDSNVTLKKILAGMPREDLPDFADAIDRKSKEVQKSAVSSNTVDKKSKEVQKSVVSSSTIKTASEQMAQLRIIELRNFVAKQRHSYNLLPVPPQLKSMQQTLMRYQTTLRSYNAVDFDGLIHLTVRVLYRHADLLQKFQNRWSYVLADEFQDTDWAQYCLVRLLCKDNKQLFVVGDMDQAIYGWRGADYHNMLDLERHFPGLTTFQLRKNYRSSKTILNLASEVMNRSIRPSELLRPMKLLATKSSGAPVTLVDCLDSEEEASFVFKKIQLLVRKRQASFGDFGILYRKRSQGQKFEQLFIANQIPYTISGSTTLLAFKEIKDLRAYLQLIWNLEDGVALDRVINVPPRGLGSKTLKSVEQWALNLKISFPQALQKISMEEISHKDLGITSKARNSLVSFCNLLGDLVQLSEHGSVSMLLKEVISRIQFCEYHERIGDDYKKRLHNISVFEGSAVAMEDEHGCGRYALRMFLEAVSLMEGTDVQEKKDSVKLSTLHAAKGLEFDYVFIVGVEQGNLPLQYSDLEEERRLFYVGVTRARKELVITNRFRTFVGGQGARQSGPSPFLQFSPSLYEQGIVHLEHCQQSRWSQN